MKQFAVIMALFAAAPAFAQDDSTASSKPEAIGVGSGAAVGAAAAGPVGAIVGAAIGAWIGDRYHQQGEARRSAEIELGEANSLLAGLDDEIDRLNSDAVKARIAAQAERESWTALVTDAINVSVLFKTDTAELSDGTRAKLARLAGLLNEFDRSAVRVEGFADPRGGDDYNDSLSARRATAVQEALVAAGVPQTRIAIVAHGEERSTATEGDLDGYALDRRVEITLVPAATELAALPH